MRARWRALALVVAVAGVLAPAAWFATNAQPDSVRVVAAAGQPERLVSLWFDGRTRHYRLFVPDQVGARPRALLLALHPLNGSAKRFEATARLDAGAATNDTVIAYPDGTGHSWDAGTCCGYAVRHHVDDVGFLVHVVDDVEHRVPIDPARVAVTGFSNGALMSYRLLCERPDVFHAAVAVAGDVVGPRCSPGRPVALLHVHGARDGVIPLSGVAWSRIDASGFPPAAASVERMAVADGCTGAVTSQPGPTIAQWTATGCAAGARVQLLTVSTLTHHDPSGPGDARRYGLDMSSLTWSFLTSP